MTPDLDHHWKVALVGVFLLRRFEYMNEDFFRISTCYPGPTWPSLFCPLTTWNHVSIVAEWLSTFVQLIPSQLLRPSRPSSQIQLVYVFPSTRSDVDVPTIGGDHVNLSRVNFAYLGTSMGALPHSLCSLSRSLRRVRLGGIHSLLTWRIGALPTPPTICSHCQPLLGHVARFHGSFEM